MALRGELCGLGVFAIDVVDAAQDFERSFSGDEQLVETIQGDVDLAVAERVKHGPGCLGFPASDQTADVFDIDRKNKQVTDNPRQFATYQSEVISCLDKATNQIKHRWRILIHHRCRNIENGFTPDKTQHR